MEAAYVESINPQERRLYWAYFLEEQKESNKQEGQYTAMDDNIPAGMNMQELM